MGRPSGKPPKPEVLERETQVVALRRQGMTWDAIAKAVGYADATGAHAAYERASVRVVKEDINAIRQIEMERLDMLQASYWQQAMTGDIPAGQQVLKIMDRRAKLLGLDMPVKQQLEVISYDANNIDNEVARLIGLLEASPTETYELDSGTYGEVGEAPSEAEPITAE